MKRIFFGVGGGVEQGRGTGGGGGGREGARVSDLFFKKRIQMKKNFLGGEGGG